MPTTTDQEHRYDRVLIVFLLALFALLSPLVNWWAADESPWYAPYVIWSAVIVLAAAAAARWDRHEF